MQHDDLGAEIAQLKRLPLESLDPVPVHATARQIYASVEQKYPEIALYLRLSAAISEGWTVGQHTQLALSIADRYPFLAAIQKGYEEGRWPISAHSFVKGFVLHDNGKYFEGIDDDIIGNFGILGGGKRDIYVNCSRLFCPIVDM